MPVIVFVSPKGGAGKTTSAVVLAGQFARSTNVTIIDADPNQPVVSWAKESNIPKNMHVIGDHNEETIVESIQNASAQTPFVIVDLEGTASKIVLMAMMQADFVIVPIQGSQLDAEQANRAFRAIRQQEKMMQSRIPGYRLPYAVLLTRTSSAIRAKTLKHILSGLVAAGIPILSSELNEREAYRAIFSYRRMLADLPPQVANLEKAIKNAENYERDVVATLRSLQQAKTEEPT